MKSKGTLVTARLIETRYVSCPLCGGDVFIKTGRGRSILLTCTDPDCGFKEDDESGEDLNMGQLEKYRMSYRPVKK